MSINRLQNVSGTRIGPVPAAVARIERSEIRDLASLSAAAPRIALTLHAGYEFASPHALRRRTVHILWILVIGFLAGVIARLLVPGPNNPTGFIVTTLIGIAGAFLATFIGQLIGLSGFVGLIGQPLWEQRALNVANDLQLPIQRAPYTTDLQQPSLLHSSKQSDLFVLPLRALRSFD
jgi:uncharacterized membrane protein YeaQ/YmgE (transglycosylase-associated protein family)